MSAPVPGWLTVLMETLESKSLDNREDRDATTQAIVIGLSEAQGRLIMRIANWLERSPTRDGVQLAAMLRRGEWT